MMATDSYNQDLQENKEFDRFEIKMYNKSQWTAIHTKKNKIISGANFRSHVTASPTSLNVNRMIS